MKEKTILFVGPLPPPVHGQSAVTEAFLRRLSEKKVPLFIIDTSTKNTTGFHRLVQKIQSNFLACFHALFGKHQSIYISLNSNAGMWLSALILLAGRIRFRPLIVHHHSYSHISKPSLRSRVLVFIGGKSTLHLLLGEKMELDFTTSYGEKYFVASVGNAAFVDSTKARGAHPNNEIVLGHLSNLCAEKGINEVVDLAIAASKRIPGVRLVVAGPMQDSAARDSVRRAQQALGKQFSYLGPIAAEEKIDFYTHVTHFIFPTRYETEASPVVILEALGAGAKVVTRDQGAVSDLVKPAVGFCSEHNQCFVEAALFWLENEGRNFSPEDSWNHFDELRSSALSELELVFDVLQVQVRASRGGREL